MRKLVRVTGGALLGVVLLATSGCVRVELEEGGYETKSATVQSEGATEIDARIDMGAGELLVSGGAADVMDAEFEYSHSSWLPKVEYDVTDGTGSLGVKTPRTLGEFPAGNTRYRWDIKLGNAYPLNLDVNMGAGEANLDLRGLDLRNLKLDLGAGETTIDLSGDWKNDLTGDITCGAGELTLKVPANVGVRIVGYRDGLGTYSADGFAQDGDALVNDAWDTATVKFEIELRRGVGDVTVETVE